MMKIHNKQEQKKLEKQFLILLHTFAKCKNTNNSQIRKKFFLLCITVFHFLVESMHTKSSLHKAIIVFFLR